MKKINRDLAAKAPDAGDFDWPVAEACEGNSDPLFNSTRDYIEQVGRFKLHQGKPTEAEPRKAYDRFPAVCTICGKPFEATSRNKSMTCSQNCRVTSRYRAANPKADAIPCRICGKPFSPYRGEAICPNKDCRNAARRKPASESGPARRGQS